MIFFKHRRSAERDAFSVPRSVQKSIPIKRIYQDGVFQVSGKFSKTWRFFDVNYAVASPEKQRELFMTYCSFLNSLPIGATAKITLFNRQLNQKDFGRTLEDIRESPVVRSVPTREKNARASSTLFFSAETVMYFS